MKQRLALTSRAIRRPVSALLPCALVASVGADAGGGGPGTAAPDKSGPKRLCADWTERSAGGPSARYDAKMAYDAAREVTILFGGGSYGGALGDTWEFGASGWSLTPAGSSCG